MINRHEEGHKQVIAFLIVNIQFRGLKGSCFLLGSRSDTQGRAPVPQRRSFTGQYGQVVLGLITFKDGPRLSLVASVMATGLPPISSVNIGPPAGLMSVQRKRRTGEMDLRCGRFCSGCRFRHRCARGEQAPGLTAHAGPASPTKARLEIQPGCRV